MISEKAAPLTAKPISANAGRVGRKRVNHEQMPARFPEGTFARLDAVLHDGENRSDVLRIALEREIARREREARKGS